jgi:hypothetical protein
MQHEVEHQIEHEQHGHGGRRKPLAESTNKKIALLISVLALFLAFSESIMCRPCDLKRLLLFGLTRRRARP